MELKPKTIGENVELSSWEDMDRKYPMWRKGLTIEEEVEFVNDCLDLFEREVFSEVFIVHNGVDLLRLLVGLCLKIQM